MKIFLFKSFIFSILVFVVYNLYYQCKTKHEVISGNNNVYVWGDSQTAEALDLNTLSRTTNLKFYSMAVHGGGVYDLSCFANRIPENSTVIIGLSSTIFLRPEYLDYNRTCLDWNSLLHAKLSGYSFPKIKEIILKNYKPRIDIPGKKNYIGSNLDNSQKKEIVEMFLQGVQISEIRKIYFISILERLKEKNCSIIIFEVPKSRLLYEIEAECKFSIPLRSINNEIFSIKDDSVNLNLEFSNSDFFDATHLNVQGAEKLSVKIGDFINSYQKLKKRKIIHIVP